jgi:hypothetical protein
MTTRKAKTKARAIDQSLRPSGFAPAFGRAVGLSARIFTARVNACPSAAELGFTAGVSECTGTCVTLWTGDIRYKSLAVLGLEWSLCVVSAVALKYLISSLRPWEYGNPDGISKE